MRVLWNTKYLNTRKFTVSAVASPVAAAKTLRDERKFVQRHRDAYGDSGTRTAAQPVAKERHQARLRQQLMVQWHS